VLVLLKPACSAEHGLTVSLILAPRSVRSSDTQVSGWSILSPGQPETPGWMGPAHRQLGKQISGHPVRPQHRSSRPSIASEPSASGDCNWLRGLIQVLVPQSPSYAVAPWEAACSTWLLEGGRTYFLPPGRYFFL